MKKIVVFVLTVSFVLCAFGGNASAALILQNYNLEIQQEDIPLLIELDKDSETYVEDVEELIFCETEGLPVSEPEYVRRGCIVQLMHLIEDIEIPMAFGTCVAFLIALCYTESNKNKNARQ